MAIINEININILKWEKYNPRKDVNRSSWFRMEHSMFDNPDYFDFSHTDVSFWIYLLSFASKKNSGSITLNLRHAERIGRFLFDDVCRALSLLEKTGDISSNVQEVKPLIEAALQSLVTSTIRVSNVQDTATYATNVRTDETNETNETKKNEESIGATSENFPKSVDQKNHLTKGKPSSPPSEVGRFIGTYVKAYQKRYGETRPDLSSKIQGQIKSFLKNTSIDRACNLIEVYLQMEVPWFKTKCHDFITFSQNLNPIGIALDTGQEQNGKLADNYFDFLKPKLEATNESSEFSN